MGKIAKKRKIPKQTLARWIRLYNTTGAAGLKNKKPGVKEKPINPKLESIVLNLWNKRKRSVYKMLKELRIINNSHYHNVSKREIDKIYKKHGLYRIY